MWIPMGDWESLLPFQTLPPPVSSQASALVFLSLGPCFTVWGSVSISFLVHLHCVSFFALLAAGPLSPTFFFSLSVYLPYLLWPICSVHIPLTFASPLSCVSAHCLSLPFSVSVPPPSICSIHIQASLPLSLPSSFPSLLCLSSVLLLSQLH